MRKLQLLLFTALVFTNTYAQKLPSVQQAGLRAPANVKIDGKAAEWDGFKAFNTATDVYYTVANDDKKLYLVFHAEQGTVASRAVVGGIRLTIQPKGSKNMQGAMSIKFPYFEKGSRIVFPVKKMGEVNTPAECDSIMKVYNQRIANSVKWMYTKGIAGTDSVISVYNDRGIQAAGAFDQTRGYTCEMAIDLALLGLSADAKQFTYNIIINAEPNKMSLSPWLSGFTSGTNADGTKVNETQLAAFNVMFQNSNNIIYATTDFWGEYTLAK